ncbi:hypothetical protein M378DRAFT_168042 [Amanita muscaria Koide BX008]|uniref:Uncharacterized protein n=1 Tax=Amanita muscaria (strain Koide BX008) TaxID=946122 RepID=A0A0C2WUU4_AMAMK|nr:hypothetical protein M378DRAFT_168042 [Amanita muscaria Koide BX008]
MGRKNRVLEELPIAPPLEPRQPTAAGPALQEPLKYRLRHILTELKRKYRRYCARASAVFIQPPRLFYAPPPAWHVMATLWMKQASLRSPRSTEDKPSYASFAEVSILQSDPALRMECQRMAVRKRKRREERRKSRGKLKEKEDSVQLLQQQNGNGNGTITRRSARANRLELDIRITDPVNLGRRLKRQRSEAGGDASTDSHTWEEGDGEGRESKRPKRASGALDGQQDTDELDIIGPSPAVARTTALAPTPSTPAPAPTSMS